MFRLVRSFAFLLAAIFVAGTFAVSAAPLIADTPAPMMAMAMTSGGQDCTKCDPKMDMMASCDLTCALSTVGALAGNVVPASVLVICHFDLTEASAKGRVTPPAFIPPRTMILI